MARAVAEWQGKTPDTAAPPRVRARVFERCNERCHKCGRHIATGEKWTLEHVIALINGGENREKNLSVTCNWCLPIKNAEDMAIKTKIARVRTKRMGIRPASKLQSRGFEKTAPQRSASRPLAKRANVFRKATT